MTQTPCAHDGCNCMVDTEAALAADTDTAEGGVYCSSDCSGANEDTQEGVCPCGHPGCDA